MSGYGVQDMRVHAPLVIASGAVFLPLCSFMVALRFWARRLQDSRYAMDDWCVLGALVSPHGSFDGEES